MYYKQSVVWPRVLRDVCCRAGNRKQFLIADSRTIYGFVESGGSKFATDCSSYTDKTCDIQCKVMRNIYTSSRL